MKNKEPDGVRQSHFQQFLIRLMFFFLLMGKKNNPMFLHEDIINPAPWAEEGIRFLFSFFFFFPEHESISYIFLIDLMCE